VYVTIACVQDKLGN